MKNIDYPICLVTIPFEPEVGGVKINVHLILEYVAFFVAYRYYVYLRKQTSDIISTTHRIAIILGAALGALIGSRVMGFLENPDFAHVTILQFLNLKTIMGGLFGGLIGVEIMKKRIGEQHSSGDLFTLPILAGIFIGRIGCFLSGTNEFTYGSVTASVFGMDLGDGLPRHPLALYELVFLIILFVFLKRMYTRKSHPPGYVFRVFMVSYFAFRFVMEFLKPNLFIVAGLSSIQWLCIICFVYYRKTIISFFRADPKIYLL